MQIGPAEVWTNRDIPSEARDVVDRVIALLNMIQERLAAGGVDRDPGLPTALQVAGRDLSSAIPSLRLYLLACDSCLEVGGNAALAGRHRLARA